MERLNKRKFKKNIFQNLIKTGYFSNFREDYINTLNSMEIPIDGIFKLNNWAMYAFFCNMIKVYIGEKDIKIVDWGGGYGQITKMLELIGYKNVTNYLLYEPIKEYSKLKEKIFIPTSYGSDTHHIHLSDNSADVFISSGVLEHVREDGTGSEESTLKEIYRILKSDGTFFIWNLPRKFSLPDFKNRLKGKWYHKYRYWRWTIVKLLENAGFEIIYMDKHKFIPDIMFNILFKLSNPVIAIKIDEITSHIFPFSIFARDFLFICKKK